MLGPTKLNHRLLDAWNALALSRDTRCRLVFVGQHHDGDYGQRLMQTIAQSPAKDRVTITGRASAAVFRAWLAAADLGVQLRTNSRGETSATALDCMNHGLATIVNANGSMAELPLDAVWMLSEDFRDEELVEALESLWRDAARRKAMGEAARNHIRTHHDPSDCAKRYFEAIEGQYAQAASGLPGLLNALVSSESPLPASEWPRLAKVLAANFPPRPRRHQLLLDISALARTDDKTGIQRVTRALLLEMALNSPTFWQVEPVYATSDAPGYRYARHFMCRFLDIDEAWTEDAPVDAWPGDVFLGLDLQQYVVLAQQPVFQAWRRRGVGIYFAIYDLIPVLLPETYPEGAETLHNQWLSAITCFDGALAISRAVADELSGWLQTFGAKRELPFALHWFHPGSDIEIQRAFTRIAV